MRIWRGWPRWLRVVAAVLVPGVLLLTYLVMVNVVLKPRVILEVRSEVPGAEVWVDGCKVGTAPLEIDVTRYLRSVNFSVWERICSAVEASGQVSARSVACRVTVGYGGGWYLDLEDPWFPNACCLSRKLDVKMEEPKGLYRRTLYWTRDRTIPFLIAS